MTDGQRAKADEILRRAKNLFDLMEPAASKEQFMLADAGWSKIVQELNDFSLTLKPADRDEVIEKMFDIWGRKN